MDIYVDTFFALSEKKVFYISELIFYTQTVKLFFPNFVLILREAVEKRSRLLTKLTVDI